MLSRGFGFGAGHTAKLASFDPATLTLSGWWRGSYSGSPWTGTASAGSSGSRNLTEGTNAPSTGAAQNGYTPGDFDGTNDILSNATTVDGFFSVSAWSMVVLFRADTTAAYGSDEYDNESLVSSAGASTATIGMAISNNGISVWHYTGADWPGVTVAAGTGAYHLARAKYDGTNIKLSIDSGAYSSQAASNIDGTSIAAETLQVGRDWNNSFFYDGRILEIMFAQSALSDANMDNIKSYINSRYALSL